jgi:hypothetical protein
MRRTDDAPEERSEAAPAAEQREERPKSVEERLAALEATMAALKPRLAVLVGETP